MILKGDCISVMKAMKPNSVDAIVTDPPYGLEFMGKEWDRLSGYFGDKDSFEYGAFALPRQRKRNIKCPKCGKWVYDHHPRECQCGGVKQLQAHQMQLWHTQWLTEAYRVLKPGGSMLVMGGTRTFHRLACAIEDSGFIIKDMLMWLYGSGFPKAQDLGKMIDKRMGKEREVVGIKKHSDNFDNAKANKAGYLADPANKNNEKCFGYGKEEISVPTTDLAQHWDGFKVGGIKPSYEPIIWAVKPPEGSYVDNVLKWGVGAVNVDECRIEGLSWKRPTTQNIRGGGYGTSQGKNDIAPRSNNKGRFPANIILDEEAGRLLDEQSGTYKTHGGRSDKQSNGLYGKLGNEYQDIGDNGGASRFFYCAKASRTERNQGLEGMEEKAYYWSSGTQSPGTFQADNTKREVKNNHPTVKPIALFEWLIRLVAREGQIILDPFLGSGTTAISAHKAGRKCIGIEKEGEYLEIANKRIEHWNNKPTQMEL